MQFHLYLHDIHITFIINSGVNVDNDIHTFLQLREKREDILCRYVSRGMRLDDPRIMMAENRIRWQ